MCARSVDWEGLTTLISALRGKGLVGQKITHRCNLDLRRSSTSTTTLLGPRYEKSVFSTRSDGNLTKEGTVLSTKDKSTGNVTSRYDLDRAQITTQYPFRENGTSTVIILVSSLVWILETATSGVSVCFSTYEGNERIESDLDLKSVVGRPSTVHYRRHRRIWSRSEIIVDSHPHRPFEPWYVVTRRNPRPSCQSLGNKTGETDVLPTEVRPLITYRYSLLISPWEKYYRPRPSEDPTYKTS